MNLIGSQRQELADLWERALHAAFYRASHLLRGLLNIVRIASECTVCGTACPWKAQCRKSGSVVGPTLRQDRPSKRISPPRRPGAAARDTGRRRPAMGAVGGR
ncbi:hypothetical protein F4560_002232 [Saccharothrix ecbatanensis]|uniref:Uncharacterized protein n=1 Tax=Saccharothrix ecbatanensis TaxID=1105145 RepID=A0A7W9HIH9_9PSEU|nr:hypothetical protein [Saccharothrix ecbatanensis]MBB5802464.1 hypothetical protein [Saccharothrix ecbatanensis]